MKRLVSLMLAMLALLCIPALASAGIPPKPDTYAHAYDFTGSVLSDADIREIERYGTALEDVTGVQVIAVVVDFLDGADPADYATDIINTWGVGSQKENDGVVVLLARGDRAIQIGTGSGIDRILTGSLCGRLIDQNIAAFADNRFSAGMRALYTDVCDYVTDAVKGSSAGHADKKQKTAVTGKTEPESGKTGQMDIPAILAGIAYMLIFGAGGYALMVGMRSRKEAAAIARPETPDDAKESREAEPLDPVMQRRPHYIPPENSVWNEAGYEAYRSAANKGTPTKSYGSSSYGSSSSGGSSYRSSSSYGSSSGGSSYRSSSSYGSSSSYSSSSSYGSSSGYDSLARMRERRRREQERERRSSGYSAGSSRAKTSSYSSSSRSSFGSGSSRGGGAGRSFGSSSSGSRSSFGGSSRSSASKSSSRSFGGGRSRGGGGGRKF